MSEKMAHLHCHTEISQLRMLDCFTKVEDLIDKAVKMGATAVAITDHESLSGHVRAIRHVKECRENGTFPEEFKLILGNEIYLIDQINYTDEGKPYCNTPFYHFILLAKDEIGHRQLRELSSNAWERSYKTGKMERVPTTKSDIEKVINSNPGHLIAQTACIGGELGKTILDIGRGHPFDSFTDTHDEKYTNERENYLVNFCEWCVNLFGEDFYLEMQPGLTDNQKTVNKYIKEMTESYGVKTIITCDVHYLDKELREIHAAYLNSREDQERELDDFYEATWMMPIDEIHSRMDGEIGKENVSVAIQNTCEIADKVSEYDLYHPTIVPTVPLPDFEVEHLFERYYPQYEYLEKYAHSDNAYDRFLLKLIEDGFYEKIPFNTLSKERFFVYIDRINIELKEMWLVTEKIGNSISSYYITTRWLIDTMWNEGDSLVGAARGSVTGMETMYLIGITQIDPIIWNLPHWRHISHEKAELSDVDIDTEKAKRSQIINAVKLKHGRRRVLNCCTFRTEGSKSAILTSGRGLGIDSDITSYIANMIPVTRGFTWSLNDCLYGNEEENRKPIPEFISECNQYPKLLETALCIENSICGRGIHASAVYLFNDDFLEHNARMKAPNGVEITQFNMKDSDYMSGLKMDFLTIESLDRIRTCMELLIEAGYMERQETLRSTYDKYLHPDVIDYETPEMWEMMANNDVVDLFQFNTAVGLQAAKRIKPHNLVEMAAANSIMRLMVSEEGAEQPIDTYIGYKNDIGQWYNSMRKDYKLTEGEIQTLEPYLKPVYGVGDTQEIVMELSMDNKITNFNVAESNRLRKSISKKNKELQAKMKKMFFSYGRKIGTSDNLLNYIWKEVVGRQLGLMKAQVKPGKHMQKWCLL